MRVWAWSLVALGLLGLCSADGGEKFEFQAEVSRLMDIIVNSLYSKKEVFLRELISNAADALDKTRYLSIENPAILADKEELEIRISFDAEERTLTIRDSGIGMTKQDLIQNLGTVAKSGTTQFVESMAAGGDLSLIGQFGVGFYSVYLVSDKVQVTSKNHEDDQYVWTSTADSTFTVERDDSGESLGRGTEIKLFLKEDALEYADQSRLESLVKLHSEFIQFPIYLHKSKTETVTEGEEDDDGDDEDEDDDDEGEDDEEDDEVTTEDEEESKKEGDKEPKTREVTTWSWERVNTQPAIWNRPSSEIEKKEYVEFYKSISGDYSDPLTWTHFRAEGEVEFKSILFIPGMAPFSQYEKYYQTKAALKLYVRKVLVTDSFEDLIPKYLNFIKGVVDSDDLPINVSREMLQEHKILKVIGKKIVRKILEMLRKLSEAEQAKRKKKTSEDEDEDDEDDEDDEEKEGEDKAEQYNKFWNSFGKHVKMGVIEDSPNRNRLTKLLRFKSTESPDQAISLDEYTGRMKEWQSDIYFLAGQDMKEIENSPFLERAKAKGVEVLLLDDPLDEYVIQQMPSYESAKLVSLAKEGVKFGDESELDEKREKLYKEDYKALGDWMKKTVEGLEKVVVSARLTDSPAVLVTGQFGYSSNMQRIMRAQAFGSGQGPMGGMGSKKIMEINPRHPIISTLKTLVSENEDSEEAKNLAWLLFDTALLSSGFDLEDTRGFSSRMYKLMQSDLKLGSLDLLPEREVPADDEEESEAKESKDEL
jgi:heat shock protein beta